MTDNVELTDQQKIEKLQQMIAEGKQLLAAAAQYAGENNIPLKYIDDYYEEPEEGEEDEDDDYGYDDEGPKLRFGGQGFRLEKQWRGETWYWHNSNC